MGGFISKIDTYMNDWFNYGLISRCPNCDNHTILSYPTTYCTKCHNRFKNNITAINVKNRYSYGCNKTMVTQYGTSDKLMYNNFPLTQLPNAQTESDKRE